MPTRFEHRLLTRLSRCRFLPGSFPKRFTRDLLAYEAGKALSPKQHITLCKLVVSYRRQVRADLVTEAKAELAHYEGGREPWEMELDETPENWDLRLVYADWLDEHGMAELAAAQRHMAARARCFLPVPIDVDGRLVWRWNTGVIGAPSSYTYDYSHGTRCFAEATLAAHLTEGMRRMDAGER